jgi:hypothetical protein
MDYTMRPLITNDIYKVSKILKKMNLKIELEGKTKEQLGAELMMEAFENLHLAETEVNEFLGGLVGLSGSEFGVLPLDESFEIMNQFKELPGVGTLFQRAGQLTK